MFVLDTDTLSLLLRAHGRVTDRVAQATEEVAITLITRIELLQGRFASVLKAENGERLIQAQHRLDENEKDSERFTILAFDSLASAEFEPPATEQETQEDWTMRPFDRGPHLGQPREPW